MSNRTKKGIVYFVIAVLSIFLIFSMNRNNNVKHEITGYQNNNSVLENKYQSMVSSDSAPTYIVNAQGHMDYQSAKTIRLIDHLFSTITSFQTQGQYNQNRNFAKTITNDQSFLGPHGFEHNMYDSSGDAEISMTHLCETTGTVHVYEMFPGQFFVAVDYFEAYNPGTFNYLDLLTPNHAEFIVNGDSHYLQRIKPVSGISLNNNNQDI